MDATPDDPYERRSNRRPTEEVTLEITDASGRLPAPARQWLRAHAAAAVSHAAPSGSESGGGHEVRVRIVADPEMATLHERHAGVGGTTDVLTFDMRTDPLDPLDVDIVICADEASRQAAGRGHGVERELLLYIVHGALHCMGHDDHDEDAARTMHEREDEILRAIGVGSVYASPDSSSSGGGASGGGGVS